MTNSVYWDSVVIIDWIENKRTERLAQIRPVVEAALRSELLIVTSALGLTECVRVNGSDPPIIEPMTPEEDEKIKAFFRSKFVEVRPIDRAIAEHARQIGRETLATPPIVKPRDALHIATAIACRCPEFHTYDRKLITNSERFNAPGLKALVICEPRYIAPAPARPVSGQKSLFDALGDGEQP